MCDMRYFKSARHKFNAAIVLLKDYEYDELFLNDVAYYLQQCIEMTLKAYLECVGVTVPNTHQIRKLINMSRNNGSPAVITQWVEEHCGEITEWEANTRYNFDYYLELNFLKEAIKVIEIFLEKNGLTEQLDIRITEDVKRKILQRMPSKAAPKSNLEWNVYYRVFSKK